MNSLIDDELVTVGKVQDSHGLKGELYISPLANDLSWLDSLTHFWIQSEKFKIESVRLHKKGFLVKTLQISDRTKADTYKGKEFQIPNELVVSKQGETIFLYEIEGFEVSTDQGVIGKITSFSSNGAQDLLIVTNENKEFQIPFIDEFIVKIDWKNKIVSMNLPVGLIES